MNPRNPAWLFVVFAVLFTLIVCGGGMGGYYWWLFGRLQEDASISGTDKDTTISNDSDDCRCELVVCPPSSPDSECPMPVCPNHDSVVCPPGSPDSECPVCPGDRDSDTGSSETGSSCIIENCVYVLTDEVGERYCAPSPPVDCRTECPVGVQIGDRVVETDMCEGNEYLSSTSEYCTRFSPGTCGGDTTCLDNEDFVDQGADIYCYETCSLTNACEAIQNDPTSDTPYSCVSLLTDCAADCPIGYYDSGTSVLAARTVTRSMCSGTWYEASDGYKYTQIITQPFCGGTASCFTNTDWDASFPTGRVVRNHSKWCEGDCTGTVQYTESQQPYECDQALPNVPCLQICPTTVVGSFFDSSHGLDYFNGVIEESNCVLYNARPYLYMKDGYRYTYIDQLNECAGDDTCHYDTIGLKSDSYCVPRGVEHCRDTKWDGVKFVCDNSFYDHDCNQRCPSVDELESYGVEDTAYTHYSVVNDSNCLTYGGERYLRLKDGKRYTFLAEEGVCNGDQTCERQLVGMYSENYCLPKGEGHCQETVWNSSDSRYFCDATYYDRDCSQVCPSSQQLEEVGVYPAIITCENYSFHANGTAYESQSGRPYYLAPNGKLYSHVSQDAACGGDGSCHYKIAEGGTLPQGTIHVLDAGVLLERDYCNTASCCLMQDDEANHHHSDMDAVCYNHNTTTRGRCDGTWSTATDECQQSSYYEQWVSVTDEVDCGQVMDCSQINYCNNSDTDAVEDHYTCVMPYQPALCNGVANPGQCLNAFSNSDTVAGAWNTTSGESWNTNQADTRIKAYQDRTTQCGAQNPNDTCNERVCFRRNYTFANGCTEERVYFKTQWDETGKWYLVNFGVYYDNASSANAMYVDMEDAGETFDGTRASYNVTASTGFIAYWLDEYASGRTSVEIGPDGVESNGWRLLYTMKSGYVVGGDAVVLRTNFIAGVGVYRNVAYLTDGSLFADELDHVYSSAIGNSDASSWHSGTIGTTTYEAGGSTSGAAAASRRAYEPLLKARTTSDAIMRFVSDASLSFATTDDGLPRGTPDEDGYYRRYDIYHNLDPAAAVYTPDDIQYIQNCLKLAQSPPPFPDICNEKFRPYETTTGDTVICDSVHDSKCYSKIDRGDGTYQCIEVPSTDCRVNGCTPVCNPNRCGPQIGECVSVITPATCNGRTDCDNIVRTVCSTSGPNAACPNPVCFRLNFLNDCTSPRLEVKTTDNHRLFAFEFYANPDVITLDMHTSQYVKQECPAKTFVYTTKETHRAQKYCDSCETCLDEFPPEPAWTTIGYVHLLNETAYTLLPSLNIVFWTVIWNGPPRNDGSHTTPDAWGDVQLQAPVYTSLVGNVGSADTSDIESFARAKQIASQIYGGPLAAFPTTLDEDVSGKPTCRSGADDDMVLQVLCAKHHQLIDHRWAGYPCLCCAGVDGQVYIPEMKDEYGECSMAQCNSEYTNSSGQQYDQANDTTRPLACHDSIDSSYCNNHCSEYDCSVFQELCEDPAAVNTGNFGTLNLLSCDAYESCLRGKALCEQVFCCPSFPDLEPCMPCDTTTDDGVQLCACTKRCEIDYKTCVGAQDAIDELARIVAEEFDQIFKTGSDMTVLTAIDQMISQKEDSDSLMNAIQNATQQTGHLTGATLQDVKATDLQAFFATGHKFMRFGNTVKRKATVDLEIGLVELNKMQRVARRLVDNTRTASLRSATTLSELVEILGANVFDAIDSHSELDRRCRKTLDMCVQTCTDSSIIAQPCALTFSCDHHLVASTLSMYALYLSDLAGYHFTNSLYPDVNSANIHVVDQNDSDVNITDTDAPGKEFTIHVGDGFGNLQSLQYSGFDRTGPITQASFDLVYFKTDRIFFHVQQVAGAVQTYGASYKSSHAVTNTPTEISIFNEVIVMYKDGDTCDVYCYDQYGTRRSKTLSCNSFNDGLLGSFCEHYWQWEFASNNEYVKHNTARRVGCQLNHTGECSTWNYITGAQIDMTCVDPCFVLHDSEPDRLACVLTGTCDQRIYGCMDNTPSVLNYMPDATLQADSQYYPERQCRYDTTYTCTIENRDPQNLGHLIAVLQCPTQTDLEGCIWLEHINKNNGEVYGDFLPPWGQMELTVRYDDPNQFVTIVPAPGVPPEEISVFEDETQCDTLYACATPVASAYQDSHIITALNVGVVGVSFRRPSQLTLMQFRPPDYQGYVIATEWDYTVEPIWSDSDLQAAQAASMRKTTRNTINLDTVVPLCASDCYSCDELFASECAALCTESQISNLKNRCDELD